MGQMKVRNFMHTWPWPRRETVRQLGHSRFEDCLRSLASVLDALSSDPILRRGSAAASRRRRTGAAVELGLAFCVGSGMRVRLQALIRVHPRHGSAQRYGLMPQHRAACAGHPTAAWIPSPCAPRARAASRRCQRGALHSARRRARMPRHVSLCSRDKLWVIAGMRACQGHQARENSAARLRGCIPCLQRFPCELGRSGRACRVQAQGVSVRTKPPTAQLPACPVLWGRRLHLWWRR